MNSIDIAYLGNINGFQTVVTGGRIYQRKVADGEIGEWKLINKSKEN